MRAERKPQAPHFEAFADYREYLRSRLERITLNANDSSRLFVYRLLATVSRGYDSPACAVLAKECGCERALTIRDSSWGNPIDSGREIGELLFDDVVERKRQDYFHNAGMPEAEFAALGDAGDVPFSGFEDVLAGCILTTGFQAAMCGILTIGASDLTCAVTTQAVRVSESFASVWDLFMCLFPSSAVKTIPISMSLAAPPSWIHGEWGDGYDRPIARRIAEDGGIPRQMFGQRKSAAATWWTLTPKPESKENYEKFRSVTSKIRRQDHRTRSFAAVLVVAAVGISWQPDRARPQKTRYPCADSTNSAAAIY